MGEEVDWDAKREGRRVVLRGGWAGWGDLTPACFRILHPPGVNHTNNISGRLLCKACFLTLLSPLVTVQSNIVCMLCGVHGVEKQNTAHQGYNSCPSE